MALFDASRELTAHLTFFLSLTIELAPPPILSTAHRHQVPFRPRPLRTRHIQRRAHPYRRITRRHIHEAAPSHQTSEHRPLTATRLGGFSAYPAAFQHDAPSMGYFLLLMNASSSYAKSKYKCGHHFQRGECQVRGTARRFEIHVVRQVQSRNILIYMGVSMASRIINLFIILHLSQQAPQFCPGFLHRHHPRLDR